MSVNGRRAIAGGVLALIAAAAIMLVLSSGEDTASTAPAGSTPAGAPDALLGHDTVAMMRPPTSPRSS